MLLDRSGSTFVSHLFGGLVCWLGCASLGSADTVENPNRHQSYVAVKEVTEGISWPQGQALPIFATPAKTLDTIEVQALTTDERITFSSLQGMVNRKQPRIYLLDARADQGRDTWADTATVGFSSRNPYDRETKYELLAKYATEIDGVVVYDSTNNAHIRNLAGTVAGLHRAIPVSKRVRANLQRHGIQLKVVVDLTTLELSSPIETYRYLYDHYWEQCEKRFIVSAQPGRRGDHHHTRDLAAACGAAVVWLDGRNSEQRELMRRFLADMKPGAAVALGWYSTERSGITTASEFGIGTMPSDHYLNATVYSGMTHQIQIPKVPPKPELENKAYIAIFISDGDNIQYAQRAMRRIWDRAVRSRGKVPLNWTIAPGLVDVGPAILNYYYTTATPNDCFVVGPSGMGYLIPFNTLEEPGAPVGLHLRDETAMNGYARLTETYLQRSGLRVVTIWDDAAPMHRESYTQHCRHLYGATVHNFRDTPSVKSSVEGQRLRFDKLIIPYAGTYRHIRNSLREQLSQWDGAAPLFLAYQVTVWGEMKPRRIVELVDEIETLFPGKTEFVRADHYFNLYNEANHLPFNLGMAQSTSIKASDSNETIQQVIDGTPATGWTSANETSWIEFDFGDNYEIVRYILRFAGEIANVPASASHRHQVQVSLDEKAWTTIHETKGQAAVTTDIEVEPINARYLRIEMGRASDAIAPSVAEVEVYGKTMSPQQRKNGRP